jgi:PAS domain S-box-containing protein
MMAVTALDHENVIMLYLLGVTYISARCGMAMSICGCVASVLAFDFFIVPPVFQFSPSDPQYMFTFAIMFVVSIVMSTFAGAVRSQTKALSNQAAMIKQAELLDLTYDAISIWNLKDFEIVFWNCGAEKIYGIKKEQIVGQSLRKIKREYSAPLEEIVSKAISDGYWDGEVTYRRLDGMIATLAIRWTVRSDANNQPDSIVEFATDISERKVAEQRVKEFYSTVSHELRTPLTSIRGGLRLLENEVIPPGSAEATEIISLASNQSDRLMALIDDILDLQKIEAGQLQLKTSQISIEAIIEIVIAELTQTAKEKNTELIVNIQSNPMVELDSNRIIQVLTNLVANAIKFSPSGSAIDVTTSLNSRGLRVTVRDNGPGIEPDKIVKLFRRFQQLDSSDTRTHGGTGLGLAISKAIVEQHGGAIGVDSEVGIGSAFWFELPC